MLAHPATDVVIMPSEKVSLGSANWRLAIFLRATMEIACKSVKETSLEETWEVERDKPHKRETQIMVGELQIVKWNDFEGALHR